MQFKPDRGHCLAEDCDTQSLSSNNSHDLALKEQLKKIQMKTFRSIMLMNTGYVKNLKPLNFTNLIKDPEIIEELTSILSKKSN